MTIENTRWRLAFARRLLQRARALLGDASPFAPAEAAISAQDAVELTLWALADANGYLGGAKQKTKRQLSFHDLVACVPAAAPHAQALEQLNSTRVQAKHFGSGPDRAETARQVERAAHAITEISVAEAPHVDVARAFLGSDLKHQIVARELTAAEAIIDDDARRDEFASHLARARFFVLQQARAVVRTPRPARPRFDTYRYQGKERELARAISQLAEQTQKDLAEYDYRFAEQMLVADHGDRIVIARLLPAIMMTQDGRLHVQPRRGAEHNLTAERRTSLLLAIVRAAEQADALDASISSLSSVDESHERVDVVSDCDAVVRIDDAEQVIARLRAGDRHVARGTRQGVSGDRIWIRVFGLDAMAPTSSFGPQGSTVPTDEGLIG